MITDEYLESHRARLVKALDLLAKFDLEAYGKVLESSPVKGQTAMPFLRGLPVLARRSLEAIDTIALWSAPVPTLAENAEKLLAQLEDSRQQVLRHDGNVKQTVHSIPSLAVAIARELEHGLAMEALRRVDYHLAPAHDLHRAIAEATREAGRLSAAELDAAKKARTELDTLLAHAKVAATELGMKAEASHFDGRANDHKKAAEKWLIGASVISAAIITGALWLFEFTIDPRAQSQALLLQALQHFLVRLIVVSVAFYALSIATRTYRAHRHNEVVNRHRATALRTFQAFVADARPEVRDEVLRQAAITAFGAQQSGFFPEGPEPAPQNTIVEIARNYAAK